MQSAPFPNTPLPWHCTRHVLPADLCRTFAPAYPLPPRSARICHDDGVDDGAECVGYRCHVAGVAADRRCAGGAGCQCAAVDHHVLLHWAGGGVSDPWAVGGSVWAAGGDPLGVGGVCGDGSVVRAVVELGDAARHAGAAWAVRRGDGGGRYRRGA